jgi:phosphate:Na+ symporter
MRKTRMVAESITAESALTAQAESIGWTVSAEIAASLAQLEHAANELDAMQRDHRAATLVSVAPGKLTATEAFARIDGARRLDRITHHAWRAAAHLLGQGGQMVEAIEQRS